MPKYMFLTLQSTSNCARRSFGLCKPGVQIISLVFSATDLVTFISEHPNGRSTIVYGVIYRIILVERLMHLAPSAVTGYVLDGIATTSGASADNSVTPQKRTSTLVKWAILLSDLRERHGWQEAF
ncbi:hypothetical protein PHMEG_00011291 [Phytophthora megakarya]|uniref:Uncharacterized protein n=1 Tax=Phytophthora megakarya TaxID=4795 RepID=A0A225WC30_9STRA|nr:hypothetical protein PHMEG_00011291 [Phytophthora megakarya]